MERGRIGGAFGGFPAGQKCENPQSPTQSAVRTNATLNARRSVLGYSVCVDQLVRLGVHSLAHSKWGGKETRFQCLLDEAVSMLDDAGDCPSRRLYIQFVEPHPGPAPGQSNCPRPKRHLSPLYSAPFNRFKTDSCTAQCQLSPLVLGLRQRNGDC